MHLAEDIYMEAMIEFWEKRTSFSTEMNIPAYILTTIKNKALNHLRHLYIKTEAVSSIQSQNLRELNLRISSLDECNPSELFAEDVKQILRKTFKELPHLTKRVFYLSRIKNKKNREIAEELNMSIKTVEFHITKALKLFTARLKDYLSILLLLI